MTNHSGKDLIKILAKKSLLSLACLSTVCLLSLNAHPAKAATTNYQAALKANKKNVENKMQDAQNRKQKDSLKAESLNLATKIKDEAKKKAAPKAKPIKKAAPKRAIVSAQQTQQTQQTQTVTSTSPKNIVRYPKDASTYGLNMNQRSGSVDIGALAHYLAAVKGTFSADEWARIITRESGGSLTATNPSSGAYGVLQLLGHGEHAGMTLGEQLAMAMPLPASAWAETAY